jgi:hypothetical protein
VELGTGWVRYEFPGPAAEGWYAAFLPGGREFLASQLFAGGVDSWPTEAGDEKRTPPKPTTEIESLPGAPRSVVVSPSRHVAIALEGGAVLLRRLGGAAPPLAPLPGEGPSLVAFTPSGRHLVALRGGRLFAWAIPGLDPPAKVSTPARAAARREVLSAVLEACCGEPTGRVFVVDETLRPGRLRLSAAEVPAERAKDAVVLPDGSWALPPQIEGVTPALFEDWLAQRAPSPAPRDLKASRPIEWLSADGFAALMPGRAAEVTPRTGEEEDPRPDPWMRHFHARFPGAGAWIRSSDVGFSPSFDQALVLVSRVGDWSSSSRWYFLRREGGQWAVVAERLSVISCG